MFIKLHLYTDGSPVLLLNTDNITSFVQDDHATVCEAIDAECWRVKESIEQIEGMLNSALDMPENKIKLKEKLR